MTLLGYTLTLSGNPAIPYHLDGPRGARYALMRCRNTPQFLFAINMKTMNTNQSVAGYTWFRDDGGFLQLEPHNS